MRKLALWLILLGLLGLSSALAQTPPPTLVIGEETTGTLTPEDFWQNYVFVGSVDNAVTLDLVGENEDLSLILLLTAPSGEVVAQDADLSSPNEALIPDFSLPEDGQYVVTILRGEGASGEAEGDYTLILSGELTEPEEIVAETETPTVTEPIVVTDGVILLPDGGIDLALSWNAAVNFDIEVRDPQGNAIFSGNAASTTGGILNEDVNADCTSATAESPSEIVSWNQGAVPTGSYEIIIYYLNGCTVGGPQQFNLTATVNGEDPIVISGTLNPTQSYLAALDIETDGSWQLYNGGVNAGLDVSLLSQPLTNAQPFTGIQVTGSLSREVPAMAYTLEGVQGDTITLNMDATTGNLDPFLILLNATGAEIARNDDRAEGNTNSTITQTLPQNGVYTIVATRYGQTIGGTEGDFNLTLSLTLAGTQAIVPVETGTDTTVGTDTATGTDTTLGTDTTVGTDTTAGANTLTTTTIRPDGLPAGSVEVILTWSSQADVQLLVRDPAGAPVYDDEPNSPSGGILQENGNAQCNGLTSPVSYVYWPASRLPRGIYEVDVWFQRNCDDTTPVTFNLVVNVQGQEIINTTQPTSLDTHYAVTFEIDQEGNSIAYDGGFFDMADVSTINYFQQLQTAETIQYGDTAPGTITAQERYKVYSFEGVTGDRVRVAMTRTGGTLDTALFLVSAQAGQLEANDDIVDPLTGERDTNSLIEYVIPSTGTYYIIATHYGLQFGGTTGNYTLALFELPPQ